jgi:hypothetical protein
MYIRDGVGVIVGKDKDVEVGFKLNPEKLAAVERIGMK